MLRSASSREGEAVAVDNADDACADNGPGFVPVAGVISRILRRTGSFMLVRFAPQVDKETARAMARAYNEEHGTRRRNVVPAQITISGEFPSASPLIVYTLDIALYPICGLREASDAAIDASWDAPIPVRATGWCRSGSHNSGFPTLNEMAAALALISGMNFGIARGLLAPLDWKRQKGVPVPRTRVMIASFGKHGTLLRDTLLHRLYEPDAFFDAAIAVHSVAAAEALIHDETALRALKLTARLAPHVLMFLESTPEIPHSGGARLLTYANLLDAPTYGDLHHALDAFGRETDLEDADDMWEWYAAKGLYDALLLPLLRYGATHMSLQRLHARFDEGGADASAAPGIRGASYAGHDLVGTIDVDAALKRLTSRGIVELHPDGGSVLLSSVAAELRHVVSNVAYFPAARESAAYDYGALSALFGEAELHDGDAESSSAAPNAGHDRRLAPPHPITLMDPLVDVCEFGPTVVTTRCSDIMGGAGVWALREELESAIAVITPTFEGAALARGAAGPKTVVFTLAALSRMRFTHKIPAVTVSGAGVSLLVLEDAHQMRVSDLRLVQDLFRSPRRVLVFGSLHEHVVSSWIDGPGCVWDLFVEHVLPAELLIPQDLGLYAEERVLAPLILDPGPCSADELLRSNPRVIVLTEETFNKIPRARFELSNDSCYGLLLLTSDAASARARAAVLDPHWDRNSFRVGDLVFDGLARRYGRIMRIFSKNRKRPPRDGGRRGGAARAHRYVKTGLRWGDADAAICLCALGEEGSYTGGDGYDAALSRFNRAGVPTEDESAHLWTIYDLLNAKLYHARVSSARNAHGRHVTAVGLFLEGASRRDLATAAALAREWVLLIGSGEQLQNALNLDRPAVPPGATTPFLQPTAFDVEQS